MALIEFVQNYEDLSTDMGYQFKFHCDRCHNGHMSRFQASAAGVAGSVLRAAGNIFGGILGSAGGSAYEVQRAVGGKAHDDALQTAVQEGKLLFKQCGRCGKWVCPQVCFNHQVGQCNDCAPNFQQEFAAAHAQAKVDAARGQLHEAAAATNYVQGVDMRGAAYVGAPQQQYVPPQQLPPQQMGQPPGGPPQDYRLPAGPQAPPPGRELATGGLAACTSCGMQLGAFKFCPGCGTPRMQATVCKQCGTQLMPGMKFCGGCGGAVG